MQFRLVLAGLKTVAWNPRRDETRWAISVWQSMHAYIAEPAASLWQLVHWSWLLIDWCARDKGPGEICARAGAAPIIGVKIPTTSIPGFNTRWRFASTGQLVF